jgi:Tfp pilus assembly protein PilF
MTADQVYDKAVSQMNSGDRGEARKTLGRVVAKDPTHAGAHFRIGEIALLNRNMGNAQRAYEAALANGARLSPQEEKLTRLGLAIATGDRDTAHRFARQIRMETPNDPDLQKIVRNFPGMFGMGGGGRAGGGQGRFPGRP